MPSVLAAITVAIKCGMSLSRAAAALQEVEPFPARMQPTQVPSGAVFLRDDYLSSLDTFHPALKVLDQARAERKVIVMSDLMDAPHTLRPRDRQSIGWVMTVLRSPTFSSSSAPTAEQARAAALDAGMDTRTGFTRSSNRDQAASYLRQELRTGDLVLLKGETRDHLARLFFAQLGRVDCWKEVCRKNMLCDICWELGLSSNDMRTGVTVPAPAPSLRE